MQDYKLFAALAAVVDTGSFERAAGKLFITPSAVSQRIRQLEERAGQTLIVRSTPAKATPTGARLLRHARQVALLEQELQDDLRGDDHERLVELPIAINNDSLNTWFIPAVKEVLITERLLLQLKVEDEAHTLGLLKNGDVLGCVTSVEQPAAGCTSTRLGEMRYRCIATPAFAARYFADGMSREAVLRAPAITFGKIDTLHSNFLASRFAVAAGEFPAMIVPSVQSLLHCIQAGLGYGICPELQWEEIQASGALADLMPADGPMVPLHWHAWELQSPRIGRFISHMVAQARARLPQ
ncbi:ArgP/LysG family DNA-binding transcriptional regulator [Rugamonas sp. FT82W]|uniref:ArgP/LysG family DNA-binding transcriptional regulator n=1 Tax=Duganella vulcania TaxID=2692166 RepID=A0A845G3H1_9BURK|nr:LysR family transcriptional regulator ArgP [Duganella vulcania]MYM88874.1 ArgP/LysG family DNA-binding transcriptional regulator [Duganella vulcania]